MPNSKRPTFDEVYMAFARSIALRSTCLRKQVGTVITSVDHRRVLAIGYNGNASGLPNICDGRVRETAGAFTQRKMPSLIATRRVIPKNSCMSRICHVRRVRSGSLTLVTLCALFTRQRLARRAE